MAISKIKIDAHQWIYDEFPYLRNAEYQITSLNDDDYNCIAWAANETNKPWWPDPNGDAFWPEGIERVWSVEAFIEAFKTLGYEACDFNSELEVGFEKVVIYIDHNRKPQHMARQLASGYWTSKLGNAWDIEHPTTQSVECNDYGQAQQILKRRRAKEERKT